MSYRLMFTINAIILAIFGVLFTILPEFVLTQFRADVYTSTLFVARFMGSALLLSGVFLWFLKDSASEDTQKYVMFLLFAYSIGGFIMSLLGITSVGFFRANGWIFLVLFGVFSLLYGYILFLQPQSSDKK